MFNVIIFFTLILHYFVGIWIYGNPNIFNNDNSSSLNSLKDSLKALMKYDNPIVKSIVIRVTLPHNILCFIFLGLLLLVFIMRITIYPLIDIFCKNQEKLNKKNVEIGIGI